MKFLQIGTVLTVMLAVGCGNAAKEERIVAIQELQPDPVAGVPVYQSSCGSCHGANGKSGSEGINIVSPLNKGDSWYLRVILWGIDDMPGFDAALSDQQAADLLGHIQTL